MANWEKLLSKFAEPRGVLRKAGEEGSEIVIPNAMNRGRDLAVSGQTPEEAAQAYQTLFSNKPPKVIPNQQAIADRLNRERSTSNEANPEEATQIIDPSLLKTGAAGLGGAAVLGGLGAGSNQASANTLNPVPSIQQGLNAIRQPIAQAARSASDAIVSGTTPLYGPEKQQFVQQNAPIFGAAAEMATDPLNYIPGGPELDMAMQFPKLRKYLQGNQ